MPVRLDHIVVNDLKTVKNRLHLDLTSGAQDRDLGLDLLTGTG